MFYFKQRLFTGLYICFLAALVLLGIYFFDIPLLQQFSTVFIWSVFILLFLTGFFYSYRGVIIPLKSKLSHPVLVGLFSSFIILVEINIALYIYYANTPTLHAIYPYTTHHLTPAFFISLVFGSIITLIATPISFFLGWFGAWLYQTCFTK